MAKFLLSPSTDLSGTQISTLKRAGINFDLLDLLSNRAFVLATSARGPVSCSNYAI
jgi:hypothetical protein